MKIGLKNIGTVKEAEIDLDKNLLVFCGPNNSGKTYVAYTLYGVYKSFNKFDRDERIKNTLKSNSNDGNITFPIDKNIVESIIREKGKENTLNLHNVFAGDINLFSKSDILIDVSNEEIAEVINKLSIKDNLLIGNIICDIEKKPYSNIVSINLSRKLNGHSDNQLNDSGYDILSRYIRNLILTSFLGNTYITPAERIAINIFSKELSINRNEFVNILLDDKYEDIDSSLKNLTRYSLPIRDSIKIAEDLAALQQTTKDYSLLATMIEEKILGGYIDVSSNGDMQFTPFESYIKGLDIHLSGSMVKSLSSLVFYFRHLANKGDFIIIDEPELNLHPDNQIIMARILARIVNAGFKVLISTHSDYIISELNNLVRLNSKKEKAQEIMERFGYEDAELLDKDALGVYLFKDNTAVNLEVDELGFDISTIQKVNSELAERMQTIYFELLDKDDE